MQKKSIIWIEASCVPTRSHRWLRNCNWSGFYPDESFATSCVCMCESVFECEREREWERERKSLLISSAYSSHFQAALGGLPPLARSQNHLSDSSQVWISPAPHPTPKRPRPNPCLPLHLLLPLPLKKHNCASWGQCRVWKFPNTEEKN